MIEGMPTSEILDDDEVAAITGFKLPRRQLAWLDENGWKYHKNRAGHPIVGRIYARMRLAGINPAKTASGKEAWSLDLSKVS